MKKGFVALLMLVGLIFAVVGCGTVPKSLVQLNIANSQNLERVKQELDATNLAFAKLFIEYTHEKTEAALLGDVGAMAYAVMEEAEFDRGIVIAEILEIYNDASKNEIQIVQDTLRAATRRIYPAYEQLKFGINLQGQSLETLSNIDYSTVFQSAENSLPAVGDIVDKYKTKKGEEDFLKKTRRERIRAENKRLREGAKNKELIPE